MQTTWNVCLKCGKMHSIHQWIPLHLIAVVLHSFCIRLHFYSTVYTELINLFKKLKTEGGVTIQDITMNQVDKIRV